MTRRTPAEQASRLSDMAAALSRRLEALEHGATLYTQDEVERIVEQRLERARDVWKRIERERDELRVEVERLRREAVGRGTPLRDAP